MKKIYQKKEITKQEKNNNHKGKLPEPIIYQDENQRNIPLTDDDDFFKQHREQTMREARAITNYFLELHKDMINSYNSEYSNLLQNIFNSSLGDLTIHEKIYKLSN